MENERFITFGTAPGEGSFVLGRHDTYEEAQAHAERLRESAKVQDLDEVYYGAIPESAYKG